MSTNYRITFFFIALISLTGCGLIPCPYYSDLDIIEQVIQEEDIIGSYRLDNGSSASGGPEELILKNNAQLTLKNIPVGLLDVFNSDYTQDPENLKDINGNWKLRANTNEPTISVELKFNEIDKDLENISPSWNLYEKNGKLVILIILGDPDSCEALKFVRKT